MSYLIVNTKYTFSANDLHLLDIQHIKNESGTPSLRRKRLMNFKHIRLQAIHIENIYLYNIYTK